MDKPRQPRTLREEDLDWISSQLYLVKVQLSGLAERIEALQQAHSRMHGVIRVLEAKVQRGAQNKCPPAMLIVQPQVILLETLDD